MSETETGVEIAAVRLDRELPLPVHAKLGDAGLDLRASELASLEPGERRLVPTGLAVAVAAAPGPAGVRVWQGVASSGHRGSLRGPVGACRPVATSRRWLDRTHARRQDRPKMSDGLSAL